MRSPQLDLLLYIDSCQKALENLEKPPTYTGASLRGADLRNLDLKGARMAWFDLEGANFEGADLRGATLFGANLSGANLSGANLEGADLSETYQDGLTKRPLKGELFSDLAITCLDLDLGVPVEIG